MEGAGSSKERLQGIDTKNRGGVKTSGRELGNRLGMILRDFED